MNNDIVVYSAIFNDYDVLLPPNTKEDVDYFCFTDEPSIVPDPWKAIEIEEPMDPPKLQSGKLKILPHREFPDYEYSIWIDGNIAISGPIMEEMEYWLDGVNMAVPAHPQRNCVYEEARECIILEKSDPHQIREQARRYRILGFPSGYGLGWTCILIRRHNSTDVIETMETWWDEFRRRSLRDQLSFEFSAWKNNLDYRYIEIDVESNPDIFSRHNHKPLGALGEAWESAIKANWKRTGGSARMYYILASALYYCSELVRRGKEGGLVQLTKEVIAFLRRKLPEGQ